MKLPSDPDFWSARARGVKLTAILGIVLLAGISLLFLTGLLSYAAYNPDLATNDQTPDTGWLRFYLFDWPTRPRWLYRLTQGVHVALGVALIPVLLTKLWSVIPKLFAWPPVTSPAHALERASLLMLVGGAVFVFATGVLNIQLSYWFPGSFYPLHLYGAWVFIAGLVAHVALRLRRSVKAVRDRDERPDELAAPQPDKRGMSRRGVLGTAAAGSGLLLAGIAGQSIEPLRGTAWFAPHGGANPEGGFQINKTAAAVKIDAASIGEQWRLSIVHAGRELTFSRAELEALPRHRMDAPIACVEGWSTADQAWSGVWLRDLARLLELDETPNALVESVQRAGAFREAELRSNQVDAGLLALRVNDADLSVDHGYPARIIVPAAPGVVNTKWVRRIRFEEA